MQPDSLSRRAAFFAALFAMTALLSCSGIEDDSGADTELPSDDDSWTYSMISANNMNMPGNGKLGASHDDSPSGAGILKLADDDYGTSFSTPHKVFSISWSGEESVKVSGYSLVSGTGNRDMDPRSWKLYASADNSDWTELDSRTDVSFGGGNVKLDYGLESGTPFRYFRLDVTANGGSESTEIAEWYLYVDVAGDCEIGEDNANMPCPGMLCYGHSDSPYGFGIANLMDGDISTKFVSRYDSFDILWEGLEEFIPESYSIASAEDFPEKDPSSWVLYGSDDNSGWTELDSRTDIGFKRNEVRKFELDVQESYKYYKLEIAGNNGSRSTQIAEWSMTAAIPNVIEDLMQYAEGFTETSSTPMGIHYLNRKVTTDEDREWLANPANEPVSSTTATGLDWKLCSVVLYPYGTPVPADVNQHAIGDCCALAVFASMAYIYPEFIKSIITDNGDNTFDVAMYDPQGKPVTVAVSSKFLVDGNGTIGAVSGKGNRATWSTVLEKAIMKWNSIYKVNVTIDGIGSEHVAPLFTGNGSSFAFMPEKLTAGQLERAVVASLRQGKLVTGGFHESNLPIDGPFYTVTGHAYTMMLPVKENALFVMRNPWGFAAGSPDGKEDGVMNIFDDGLIPPSVDVRIMEPGAAAKYAQEELGPYYPPKFSAGAENMRLSAGLKAFYSLEF